MSHRKTVCVALFVSLLSAVPASAEIVMRESDIQNLRLGQRVYVDDGSCPAGQIREVSGVKLTAAGVARVRKCADRKTMRR
ncbi:hypothetical protein V1291_000602 [Nitrobacteraceae bacterium AZCC 1564]